MDFESLSDNEIEESVLQLSLSEKKATVKLLWYLNEFSKRKIYLELGYSSMFDYCTRKLKHSEGGAYRRIAAARALGENPEIESLLLSGEVSLCTVAIASKSIKSNKATIEEIAGKSKREVERVLSRDASFTVKPKEVVKSIVLESKGTAPSLPLQLSSPPTEERYKLGFSVTKEVYEKLNKAKAKLSNALPDLSLESLLEKLLDNYLNKTQRKSVRVSKGYSRYVSSSIKNTVYERDQGQCTYIAKDGTRCCEKHYLHFDHKDPYALGGQTTVENLRLLCAAHNQYESKQAFG